MRFSAIPVLLGCTFILSFVSVAPAAAGETVLAVDPDASVWFVGEDDGAYLGVRLREETEHPEGGARVTHVVDGSPADEAGLEEGDIILKFDRHVIRGPAALTEKIHEREPGESVSLTVERDGRERVVDVELGSRGQGLFAPRAFSLDGDDLHLFEQELKERMEGLDERLGEGQWNVLRNYNFAWGRPRLGVQLIETTPELREHLGSDEDTGVLVSKVLAGTPAEHAGIAVGDLIVEVDGDDIGSTGDLVEALSERAGESFGITVLRDGKSQTIDVTLPEVEEAPVTGPRAYNRWPAPSPPRNRSARCALSVLPVLPGPRCPCSPIPWTRGARSDPNRSGPSPSVPRRPGRSLSRLVPRLPPPPDRRYSRLDRRPGSRIESARPPHNAAEERTSCWICPGERESSEPKTPSSSSARWASFRPRAATSCRSASVSPISRRRRTSAWRGSARSPPVTPVTPPRRESPSCVRPLRRTSREPGASPFSRTTSSADAAGNRSSRTACSP
jgi:serine protease Do